MTCYCFLRNIVDLVAVKTPIIHSAGGDSSPETATAIENVEIATPYKHRYGEDFRGPALPFGCEVDYLPSSDKEKDSRHKFGDKTCRGIFPGYHQLVGGGWSGDLLIANWDQIENAQDFSEIYVQRIKAGEVNPSGGPGHRFPLAEGTLRQPGSHPNSSLPKERKKKDAEFPEKETQRIREASISTTKMQVETPCRQKEDLLMMEIIGL